jgi:hypothetical protein
MSSGVKSDDSHLNQIRIIFDENTDIESYISKQQKINQNFCSECLTEYYLQEKTTNKLLKIFLSQNITCYQAIETILNFLENEILTGHKALEVVEEIHVKVFNLRFCSKEEQSFNLDLLEKMSIIFLDLLEANSSTNGMLNLFELFPVLISTCQYIEDLNPSLEKSISKEFLSNLFEISIPSKFVLSFLKIFSEIEINEIEVLFLF